MSTAIMAVVGVYYDSPLAAAALAALGIYARPGAKPGRADELAITGMEKKKQITMISN